jgi:sugar lactone lactonase YvrE
MAGAHQIWRLDLKTGDISPAIGALLEARIDGPLKRGALSEAHGLTAWENRLFIADSQVNAIRAADLGPQGRLWTLAGGDLFDFGDREGKGKDARFQFPTGLATDGERLYVADTFNHKIRRIRIADGTVDTLAGTGEPGRRDGRRALFHEPAGLALAGEKLFIADRNNHAIRWADRQTGAVETLAVRE